MPGVKKRAPDLEGQKPKPAIVDPDEKPIHKYDDELLREIDPGEIHTGYDTEVHDWLLLNSLLDKSYVVRLYKIEDSKRVHVKKYVDHVPDEDEVGSNFGSGAYDAILQITDQENKRRVISKKFQCHSSYDNRMLKDQGGNGGQQIIRMGDNGGIGPAMNMMKEVMAMIIPLLTVSKSTNSPDMSEMMVKNYDMMNQIMKRSLTDSQQMFNDVQRAGMGLTEVTENDEESSGVMGMINTLAPMLEKFLPLIIGKANPMQAVAIEAVKKTPDFLKLTKSQRMLKELVGFIDKKHGKDMTRQLLSKFKLKRPKSIKPTNTA